VEVKREAAWAIANATSSGSAEQIRHLVTEEGVLQPLCDLLADADGKLAMVALEGIENVLKAGAGHAGGVPNGVAAGAEKAINEYANWVDEVGGLDALEKLQSHDDEKVYKKAVQILETFFEVDEGKGDA